MSTARLSQLQKRIVSWLLRDEQRPRGVLASSHQELVRALQADKGNVSQRALITASATFGHLR